MLTIEEARGAQPGLVLRGTIEGIDLRSFGEALEQVTREAGETILLDVSDVEQWSLLAQAMVLSVARRMSRRGGQLILCGPSADLRRQSRPMNVFDLVPTRGPDDQE